MTKRWLIRGLFLLPVVLCLAGWGWSGWYEGMVRYHRGNRWVSLGTGDGAVVLWSMWNPYLRDGYEAEVVHNDPVRFWPPPLDDHTCFLGFRWSYNSYGIWASEVGPDFSLAIPYWFPLLVSALLLLGAWRKTRRRDNPATAFPVVMKDGPEVKRIQS